MKFSKVTSKISGFFNHIAGVAITSASLTLGAMFILPSNAPEQIWDNTPTEKTSEIMVEMKQNIVDIVPLAKHLLELEPEMDRLEKQNTQNMEWAKDGLTEDVLDKWLIYTIEKSNIMIEFDKRAKPFIDKESEFVRQILTNDNIPEDKALELVKEYVDKGFYTGIMPLPPLDRVHLLREVQKENPDLDVNKIYKALQDKNINGHIRVTPAIIGMFSWWILAAGAKKWDENVKKKEGTSPEDNQDNQENDTKMVANDVIDLPANNATKNTLKPKI